MNSSFKDLPDWLQELWKTNTPLARRAENWIDQQAAPLPATPFPREQLVGAIARAWCHKPNEHKPMDSDLVTAIELEIVDLVDHYAKGV